MKESRKLLAYLEKEFGKDRFNQPKIHPKKESEKMAGRWKRTEAETISLGSSFMALEGARGILIPSISG